MFTYKDLNYVNYVMDLPLNEGLQIYNLCIGRFNNKIKEKEDARIWDMYLLAVELQEFEGNFESYKNKMITNTETRQLTNKIANEEYDRITKNVNKIIKLKRGMTNGKL